MDKSRETADETADTSEETAGRTESAGSSRPSFGSRVVHFVTETSLILVGAVIISVILRTFVAQMFVIPSGSMENTLQVNDRVLVSKFGGFQRGDVVVFEDPSDWLTLPPREPNVIRDTLEFIGVLPSSRTEHLIKRVIGMPGDHVRCCTTQGRIEVNGKALEEEPYLFAQDGAHVAPANVPFDVVVPADRIFVMGDHRNASADSRCRLNRKNQGQPPGMDAFVPMDRVVGAAVAIVAPLHRMSAFHIPQTFADVPDPSGPAPAEPQLIQVNDGC